MKIEHLERINEIVSQVKELDAEIKEIDEIAKLAATGKGKANLELSMRDEYIEKEKREDIFDEHGFIHKRYLDAKEPIKNRLGSLWGRDREMFGGIFLNDSPGMAPPLPTNRVKQILSDSAVLSICNILLLEKRNRRKELADLLYPFGINLR